MAMFDGAPQRPEPYRRFEREVPQWYRDAKFGIFVHWGAYSVPAWAEPTGELGTVDERTWFAHNPYAEWYANTVRIDGSPAQQHHREVHGGAPYDEFLDRWGAEEFDATALVDLFRRAGARYVVPTTKHHDGIALWDAPGTGDRNTVRRGPRRDLVGEFAAATRAAGLRFGTYYSGGLDWWFTDFPPITGMDFSAVRPVDEAYTEYATAHVADLVDRYAPDVLWGDIEWPDAGKPEGPRSFAHLLDRFYTAAPDGVVNDRWGLTHWDFRTSEYQQGRSVETSAAWENCRGIGLSFGHNRAEGPEHHLDGPAAVRHLLDVVSRGGNLLLNVGPDAAGRVPELQRRCLEQVAAWMELHADAVHGTEVFAGGGASEEPWVRWTLRGRTAHAVVEAEGRVRLPVHAGRLDVAGARLLDGTAVAAREVDGGVEVELPERSVPGPQVVALDLA
ncbi:alpha-L-fucosidase [Kineococcus terrestris]|uniref:alpha-L-fucosidase n=1 Tax=Kineococcus terrestris TaxID=2044856 RepID=UPI0035A1AA00